jgi:hypothetical protein
VRSVIERGYQEEEYHKVYIITRYENTEYTDVDPPDDPNDSRYTHLNVMESWFSPKHPKIRLEPFEQFVQWGFEGMTGNKEGV